MNVVAGACILDSDAPQPTHAPESCRIHDYEVQDNLDMHHVSDVTLLHIDYQFYVN